MDTRLPEYLLKIQEEHSITKAAEKLFVTQSALNQQLQKLERELGTPLSVRTRSDWQPTQAGHVYLQAAREILNIKKDAYNQIADIRETADRTITIGLTPERGVNMFSTVYPEFHHHFPQIQLEPLECNVLTMQNLFSRGVLDLGLLTLAPWQRDDNTYLPLAEEEFFLAVPASHPLFASGSHTPEDAPTIGLEAFAESPFILIFRRSTMYQLVEDLFRDAGFSPNILFTTSSNISQYRMVLADIGCAILPQPYAVPDDRAAFFRFHGTPRWEISMCHLKGA